MTTSQDRREHETVLVIGALERYVAGEHPAAAQSWVDDAKTLLRDLQSGEMVLAHCADDECSHGWHYTEHRPGWDIGPRLTGILLVLVALLAAVLL